MNFGMPECSHNIPACGNGSWKGGLPVRRHIATPDSFSIEADRIGLLGSPFSAHAEHVVRGDPGHRSARRSSLPDFLAVDADGDFRCNAQVIPDLLIFLCWGFSWHTRPVFNAYKPGELPAHLIRLWAVHNSADSEAGKTGISSFVPNSPWHR